MHESEIERVTCDHVNQDAVTRLQVAHVEKHVITEKMTGFSLYHTGICHVILSIWCRIKNVVYWIAKTCTVAQNDSRHKKYDAKYLNYIFLIK